MMSWWGSCSEWHSKKPRKEEKGGKCKMKLFRRYFTEFYTSARLYCVRSANYDWPTYLRLQAINPSFSQVSQSLSTHEQAKVNIKKFTSASTTSYWSTELWWSRLFIHESSFCHFDCKRLKRIGKNPFTKIIFNHLKIQWRLAWYRLSALPDDLFFTCVLKPVK